MIEIWNAYDMYLIFYGHIRFNEATNQTHVPVNMAKIDKISKVVGKKENIKKKNLWAHI